MNHSYQNQYTILPSSIHGNGVFSTKKLRKDHTIGIGIYYSWYIFPVVTPEFGSMINHSYHPTAYLYYNTQQGVYEVRCKGDILSGVEITLDYNDTPWFIRKPEAHYK